MVWVMHVVWVVVIGVVCVMHVVWVVVTDVVWVMRVVILLVIGRYSMGCVFPYMFQWELDVLMSVIVGGLGVSALRLLKKPIKTRDQNTAQRSVTLSTSKKKVPVTMATTCLRRQSSTYIAPELQ